MEYLRSQYLSIPKKPGVYRFFDENSNILYVGKAIDLRSRVSSYFANSSILGEKTRILVSQISKIKITLVESEIESLLLEAYYIKKFQPKYNIRLTDGKSYPLIRIRIKDKYPSVLFARKVDDKDSVYFGPYPSSSSVRLVLRLLRRIFPYVSVLNHPKKICLYNHLGLCPCPQVLDSDEMKKSYSENIKRTVQILNGNAKKIQNSLIKERNIFMKNENFEKAQELQKQIDALSYVTTPFKQGFEYAQNPNLRADLRTEELKDLKNILSSNSLNVQLPDKIECYDISNFQGTNTTASMVVFVNGEKESGLYRKFIIKRDGTPDDFASMQEVLRRRLKHTDWAYPDLIVVDGGKGQVSSALETLESEGVNIPLIGLAKREETIIIPINGSFVEVLLPKDSKSLLLLRRIRDEAHRFAVTFHKKRRSSRAFV